MVKGETKASYATVASESNMDLWHCRLRHASDSVLQRLARGKGATGVKLTGGDERQFCTGCALAKSVRHKPKSTDNKRATRIWLLFIVTCAVL